MGRPLMPARWWDKNRTPADSKELLLPSPILGGVASSRLRAPE